MRTLTFRTLFIATLAAVAIGVACGGDNEGTATAAGPNGAGGGTMPVTAAMLESLPPYEGATMVRDWLVGGGSSQVREFAVNEPPEQAADSVTQHFRAYLLDNGWQESEAHAAVSAFTKDGRRVVIGRVGPDIQEPPTDATVLSTSEVPAGTAFFFTMEADEAE
jgi:hypothetical protein